MNINGQMIISKSDHATLGKFSDEQISIMKRRGMTQMHEVRGFFEAPAFLFPTPGSIEMYSASDGAIGGGIRMIAKGIPEEDSDPQACMTELVKGSLSGFAIRLARYDISIKASRAGWTAYGFRGFLSQNGAPKMFNGIFYELFVDLGADSAYFFPVVAQRVYDAVDLEKDSHEEISKAGVWGYGVTGHNIEEKA